MEDQLHEVLGLEPEGDAVLVVDAEAGRVPLDLLRDFGVGGQNVKGSETPATSLSIWVAAHGIRQRRGQESIGPFLRECA